ncbi:hypothetical protein O5D80_002191 [Batrachochytrium dendrobatidis]|nr:hypothetical protein O5D80_002191 [Batrachochytrium dendrobatidis]
MLAKIYRVILVLMATYHFVVATPYFSEEMFDSHACGDSKPCSNLYRRNEDVNSFGKYPALLPKFVSYLSKFLLGSSDPVLQHPSVTQYKTTQAYTTSTTQTIEPEDSCYPEGYPINSNDSCAESKTMPYGTMTGTMTATKTMTYPVYPTYKSTTDEEESTTDAFYPTKSVTYPVPTRTIRTTTTTSVYKHQSTAKTRLATISQPKKASTTISNKRSASSNLPSITPTPN